eukprot:gene25079-31493_t
MSADRKKSVNFYAYDVNNPVLKAKKLTLKDVTLGNKDLIVAILKSAEKALVQGNSSAVTPSSKKSKGRKNNKATPTPTNNAQKSTHIPASVPEALIGTDKVLCDLQPASLLLGVKGEYVNRSLLNSADTDSTTTTDEPTKSEPQPEPEVPVVEYSAFGKKADLVIAVPAATPSAPVIVDFPPLDVRTVLHNGPISVLSINAPQPNSATSATVVTDSSSSTIDLTKKTTPVTATAPAHVIDVFEQQNSKSGTDNESVAVATVSIPTTSLPSTISTQYITDKERTLGADLIEAITLPHYLK